MTITTSLRWKKRRQKISQTVDIITEKYFSLESQTYVKIGAFVEEEHHLKVPAVAQAEVQLMKKKEKNKLKG